MMDGCPTTVYPRVCGGTRQQQDGRRLCRGLSPRVRGNRIIYPSRLAMPRSIPACAGEPLQHMQGFPIAFLYPRVCGGTPLQNATQVNDQGLSPRVRGNRYRPDPQQACRRSIPACAGEPTRPATHRRDTAVYPRVCGGTDSVCRVCGEHQGLSPRVRGNRSRPVRCDRRTGSIPACAGEPCRRGARGTPMSVYPRVCGGTAGGAHQTRAMFGLSPRVRGNPSGLCLWCEWVRSIPACAGEPNACRHSQAA